MKRVGEMLPLMSLIFLSAVGGNSDFPEVKIEQGRIKGKAMETWKGRPINAFTSIPYAEPPVNDLRFKVRTTDYFYIITVVRVEALDFFKV